MINGIDEKVFEMNVPLARRNLLYEKSKLVLNVPGIAAALALILLLSGLREGMYTTLTAYVQRMDVDLILVQTGVRSMLSSNSSIPASEHGEIASVSNAAETAHILVSSIIFTDTDMKTPVLLVGYDPVTSVGGPWNIAEGRGVESDDEILLDIWLAHRNNIAVGDTTRILNRDFRVVGLTRETSSWVSPYIFVSQKAAEDILQLPGIASFYLLRLPEGADMTSIAETIEAEVDGVEALTPEEMAKADRKVLAAMLDTPLNLVIAIGFVIGTAVMGLTVYIAVTDHMEEYAVLKAVGASGIWLQKLVLLETLYRTVSGFLLGVGLAFLAGRLIMGLMPQFTVILRLEIIGMTGLAALIMALIAAVLPVRRIMALDPNGVFTA